MNPAVAADVLKVYQQIDQQTAAFQAATGLRCAAGCGRCCDNPHIEATPLEMLPAALELIRRAEAEQRLTQLASLGSPSLCSFYEVDEAVPGNGRCQMYTWRPTLCRLFGYAASRDKQGQAVLATCAGHAIAMPEVLSDAQGAIANGLPVPLFADWQSQVSSIDPHWGTQQMPINQALRVALERLSLVIAYQTASLEDS
ncbi:MAG TPA: YkgJ family cysteine cluster protein [Trichocoleus sp.]